MCKCNKICTFAFDFKVKMAEERDESYSHVLKYTGIFGGVQGLNILIGLVRNKFVALLLGPAGMGLASLLMSVQNFASQFTNLGISFGAVPRLSELYDEQSDERLLHFIQVVRLWSLIAAGLGILFCVVSSSFADTLTFTWGNHTLHYAVLGVSVAMLAITGGETAILKATRRLGALAKIQIITALLSLVISVPLYYFLFHSGVMPVIVLTALVTMLSTIYYSYDYYNYNNSAAKVLLFLHMRKMHKLVHFTCFSMSSTSKLNCATAPNFCPASLSDGPQW